MCVIDEQLAHYFLARSRERFANNTMIRFLTAGESHEKGLV